jgi:hypothetical protein
VVDEGRPRWPLVSQGQRHDEGIDRVLVTRPLADAPQRPGGVSPHAFAWSKAATESRWIVQPTTAGEATAITISKAWVQTWITPHVRQERVALRINTMQEVLRVKLTDGDLSDAGTIDFTDIDQTDNPTTAVSSTVITPTNVTLSGAQSAAWCRSCHCRWASGSRRARSLRPRRGVRGMGASETPTLPDVPEF